MTNVSADTCRKVTAEIRAAVEPILEAHGLTMDKTSAKYGDLYALTIKAHGQSVNADGIDEGDPQVQDWFTMARIHGVPDPAEWMTTPRKIRGREYVVAGWSYRSRKYPLLMRDLSDGQVYKFQESVLEQFLNV